MGNFLEISRKLTENFKFFFKKIFEILSTSPLHLFTHPITHPNPHFTPYILPISCQRNSVTAFLRPNTYSRFVALCRVAKVRPIAYCFGGLSDALFWGAALARCVPPSCNVQKKENHLLKKFMHEQNKTKQNKYKYEIRTN